MKLQLNELERRNFEINILSEISDLLQASLDLQEAYTVLQQVVPALFPNLSGGVFIYHASKNLLDIVSSWGETPLKSDPFFTPKLCWGLRRGHSHLFSSDENGVICPHIHRDVFEDNSEDNPEFVSLCIPMMAHGESLGTLYLYSSRIRDLTRTQQNLAAAVAEHIALGLANLRLRETLENQSIKDSLTGLHNRRFLEEYLAKEFHQAERRKQKIGIIMIDFDHFKKFNDTFGHDAGDMVLKKISDYLRSSIRKSDVACRYGGEELVIVMPESSVEETQMRAERLREGVKNLSFSNTQYDIDGVTISLGVSGFPDHGSTSEELLMAADKALYEAKAQGRDRVVVAG
jgi:diguanylate cyclase (GGDEF)-like protein